MLCIFPGNVLLLVPVSCGCLSEHFLNGARSTFRPLYVSYWSCLLTSLITCRLWLWAQHWCRVQECFYLTFDTMRNVVGWCMPCLSDNEETWHSCFEDCDDDVRRLGTQWIVSSLLRCGTYHLSDIWCKYWQIFVSWQMSLSNAGPRYIWGLYC